MKASTGLGELLGKGRQPELFKNFALQYSWHNLLYYKFTTQALGTFLQSEVYIDLYMLKKKGIQIHNGR